MSTNLYQYDGGENNSSKRIHILSVGYMVLLYVAVLTLELFEVIPFLFKDKWSYVVHLASFIYSMVNIGSYYYAVVVSDVSCRQNSPSPKHGMKTGFFFCQSCQQNCPPRAHHCGICGTCIDRRDHHCYFIANCIGQSNLRYFIVLNVWVGIFSVYCVIMNLVYLHHHILPLSPITVQGILQLLPVVTIYKYFVSNIGLFQLMVVIVTWLTFVQILVSLACGGFQTRLLCTGQTTYEFSHHVFTHDHGWRHNFKDVCGNYWYISWLFPAWPKKFGNVESVDEKLHWSGREEDNPRKVI